MVSYNCVFFLFTNFFSLKEENRFGFEWKFEFKIFPQTHFPVIQLFFDRKKGNSSHHHLAKQFIQYVEHFHLMREKHFSFYLNFHRETYTILFLSSEFNIISKGLIIVFRFYEMYTLSACLCAVMAGTKYKLLDCVKFFFM